MTPGARTLKLGTRGSPLALWQARWVVEALRRAGAGLDVEIVTIRTRAESFPEKDIAAIGVGVFTREIDEALRRGEIDLGVHSMKDVPSELAPGLEIAAVPERESPLDAFIAHDGSRLEALPRGAKIGTSSPRRRSQLLHFRPDFVVAPLRGNVGTRLRKLEAEGFAGTVLAHAGLLRLGEEGRITQLLPTETMLPAVGQGALAVVARAGERELAALLGAIDHAPSRARARAERSFLRRLRGGCQVPAGALATWSEGDAGGGDLRLEAVVASPDGATLFRGAATGPAAEAEAIGLRLAQDLLERGAERILAALRG
jgi:hydroxymethylbilane synthase